MKKQFTNFIAQLLAALIIFQSCGTFDLDSGNRIKADNQQNNKNQDQHQHYKTKDGYIVSFDEENNFADVDYNFSRGSCEKRVPLVLDPNFSINSITPENSKYFIHLLKNNKDKTIVFVGRRGLRGGSGLEKQISGYVSGVRDGNPVMNTLTSSLGNSSNSGSNNRSTTVGGGYRSSMGVNNVGGSNNNSSSGGSIPRSGEVSWSGRTSPYKGKSFVRIDSLNSMVAETPEWKKEPLESYVNQLVEYLKPDKCVIYSPDFQKDFLDSMKSDGYSGSDLGSVVNKVDGILRGSYGKQVVEQRSLEYLSASIKKLSEQENSQISKNNQEGSEGSNNPVVSVEEFLCKTFVEKQGLVLTAVTELCDKVIPIREKENVDPCLKSICDKHISEAVSAMNKVMLNMIGGVKSEKLAIDNIINDKKDFVEEEVKNLLKQVEVFALKTLSNERIDLTEEDKKEIEEIGVKSFIRIETESKTINEKIDNILVKFSEVKAQEAYDQVKKWNDVCKKILSLSEFIEKGAKRKEELFVKKTKDLLIQKNADPSIIETVISKNLERGLLQKEKADAKKEYRIILELSKGAESEYEANFYKDKVDEAKKNFLDLRAECERSCKDLGEEYVSSGEENNFRSSAFRKWEKGGQEKIVEGVSLFNTFMKTVVTTVPEKCEQSVKGFVKMLEDPKATVDGLVDTIYNFPELVDVIAEYCKKFPDLPAKQQVKDIGNVVSELIVVFVVPELVADLLTGANLARIGEAGLVVGRAGNVSEEVLMSSERIEKLIMSAKEVDRNGLSNVGRGLQKHIGRKDPSFQGIDFSHINANELGEMVLKEVLESNNKRIVAEFNGTNTIFDTVSGRGVNISREGVFNGFRDLKNKTE